VELSFVTYNIHKGIGNDRLYRLERIVQALRETRADVLCLQEVDHNVPRSRSEDTARILAEELGFEYNLGLNVKLKKGAYGNATLSRFPVTESRNLNLTWGIKKRRGCLVSRIETPAGEVAVFNFHLGLAAFERMWQTRKLLDSHTLKGMRHLPLVLLGDTNDRNHRLDPVFREAGFADSSEGRRGLPTWPSYAPILRLDKVFYSQEHWTLVRHHVSRTQVTKVASDHLPLVVTLKT